MATPGPDSFARRRRFEAVFAAVYEPVQRYVRRRVQPDSVDDVVSETMATVWRRLDDVPTQAVLPWVYGVARRQVANQRRAAGRQLRLAHRVESEPAYPSPADHPLDAELETALGSLDEAERELLRLWAWEQLEPAEIAVVLGVSPNAVSIRLHRAKAKLGKRLDTARKNKVLSGHSHRVREEDGS
jgi:RNA polymerase sigma-70 factor (ECF subfamily)